MSDLWARLLQLAYFMLPACCANMAPLFTRYWRGWNRPAHERLLGSHKTVLGVLAGVATGVLVARLQSRIHAPRNTPVNDAGGILPDDSCRRARTGKSSEDCGTVERRYVRAAFCSEGKLCGFNRPGLCGWCK